MEPAHTILYHFASIPKVRNDNLQFIGDIFGTMQPFIFSIFGEMKLFFNYLIRKRQ